MLSQEPPQSQQINYLHISCWPFYKHAHISLTSALDPAFLSLHPSIPPASPSLSLPVDDAPTVQELKGADKFGSIEACSVWLETLRLLDLKHEVATVQILHHEEQMTLKAAYVKSVVQTVYQRNWTKRCKGKHTLTGINIIILSAKHPWKVSGVLPVIQMCYL